MPNIEEALEVKTLSKRERRELRKSRRQIKPVSQKPSIQLREIFPKTAAQRIVFNAFDTHNLVLHGIAGTGKSFISFYLALDQIFNHDNYKKFIIVRSAVPTRDLGFQPGNLKEKARVYEEPYMAICEELFGRSEAYENLKNQGKIQFITTSYIRGITMKDCVVLIDEIQNMSGGELSSLATRVGQNCKVIFSGDIRQTDLEGRGKDKSGLPEFLKIVTSMKSVKTVEFNVEDIVRSGFVKEFIIAKDRYEQRVAQRTDAGYTNGHTTDFPKVIQPNGHGGSFAITEP